MSQFECDKAHVRDLISVGLVTESVAEALPEDLRQRLDEIRANPDG